MIRLVSKDNTDSSTVCRQAGLELQPPWTCNTATLQLLKTLSEAFGGEIKLSKHRFGALRADQTYLFASETKRSSKSFKI